MSLLLVPLLFYVGFILSIFFSRASFIILLLALIATSALLPFLPHDEVFAWLEIGDWAIKWTFHLDAWAWSLVVLVNMMGLLVSIYSRAYFSVKPKGRFDAYLLLFIGSMQGIWISNHAVALLFFWELVGISSFLLIGYFYEREEAGRGSMQALWLNKIGDVGLLLGVLWMGAATGTYEIGSWERASLPNEAILYLLSLGALAKSAQGPFMVWLPGAMAGPTPASALIHAATMVAAGIYFLFRIQHLFTPDFQMFLAVVGGLTALSSAFVALFQNALKRLLACSTISQLGLMLIAVASPFPETALWHLWAHAFFKAGLFLSAGYFIHYQEEHFPTNHDAQDIRFMGHFFHSQRIVFIAFIIQALGLIGFPFTAAFLTKEQILAVAPNTVVFFIILLTSALTILYSLRMLYMVGLGHDKINLNDGHSSYQKQILWLAPIGLLSLMTGFWAVSWNPLHIISDTMPKPSASIFIISISLISLVAVIFWWKRSMFLNLNIEKPFIQFCNGFWEMESVLKRILPLEPYFLMEGQQMEGKAQTVILNIAQWTSWIDKYLWDGLIHRLYVYLVNSSKYNLKFSLSHIVQGIDTFLWDLMIVGFARTVWRLSTLGTIVQTGNLQRLLTFVILCLLLILWLIKYF